MQNNKLPKKGSLLLLLTIIISIVLLFDGCDKAKEAVEDASKTVQETTEKAADKVAETTDSVVSKAAENVEDAAKKVEEVVSEKPLIGVWIGKLDSRLTTLTITAEDGDQITGKITINYRQQINQDVKGKFNSETKTLTLQDQIHTRYMGKYSGKISEDGKIYSGTYTTLVDKNSASFNLTKKIN
jgi:hypothetical protein